MDSTIYERDDVKNAIAKADRLSAEREEPYAVWAHARGQPLYVTADDGDALAGCKMIYSTADGRLL